MVPSYPEVLLKEKRMPTKTETPAISTGAPASDYTLRPEVSEIIAYWVERVPMLHNAAAKCMKRWDDLEIKSSDWAASELLAEQTAERDGNGGSAAHQFCTRCLVKLTAEAVARLQQERADRKVTEIMTPNGPVEVELVTDPDREPGARLNAEAAELAALDEPIELPATAEVEPAEVPETKPPVVEKPAAKPRRAGGPARKPATRTASRGTKLS